MSRIRAYALTLALVLIAPARGGAEIGLQPTIETDERNLVPAIIGFDEALLTGGIGYGRSFPLERLDRTLVVVTDFSTPFMHPDIRDFRWRVGVRMNAIQLEGGFALPVELNFALRGTDNSLFRSLGVGTELGVMPGYYASRWFVAAEVFWDQQWTTHLRHSDNYREFVYDGAQDGWYGASSFFMRYGLRVGGLAWRHLELMLRGGYEQHGRYETRVPPFYAILSLCFRF
jgi:hypothetical protein